MFAKRYSFANPPQLDDAKKEEALFVRRSKARIDHLAELGETVNVDSPQFARWNETRLNRLLVDYMLRQGFVSTGELLANHAGIKVMQGEKSGNAMQPTQPSSPPNRTSSTSSSLCRRKRLRALC